jgi:hypothetical protein
VTYCGCYQSDHGDRNLPARSPILTEVDWEEMSKSGSKGRGAPGEIQVTYYRDDAFISIRLGPFHQSISSEILALCQYRYFQRFRTHLGHSRESICIMRQLIPDNMSNLSC